MNAKQFLNILVMISQVAWIILGTEVMLYFRVRPATVTCIASLLSVALGFVFFRNYRLAGQ